MTKLKKISQILILLLLLAGMGLALKISSGKVRLIFSLLTLLCVGGALFPAFQRNVILSRLKSLFLPGLVMVFLLLNLYYNTKNLGRIVPFRTFVNQQIYQESDLANGTYPDVYVRQLIRDKTIRLKYAPTPFENYNVHGNEEERAEQFDQNYYRKNNYPRFFEEYAKATLVDETMPTLYDLTAAEEGMEEAVRQGFTDLGLANDMLRYTFLLNPDGQKESAYFWYSWYYYSYSNEDQNYPHVYVMMEECRQQEILVAMWDRTGDLFLMPESVYEERFSSMVGEWSRKKK